MPFNNPKLKVSEAGKVVIGTQTASTVVIGPIKVDSGLLQGMLSTVSNGTTTPTAYTAQISLDESGAAATFGNLPTSVTITAATTSGNVTHVAIPETPCFWFRVISGAAFAAGTADLRFLGIEK